MFTGSGANGKSTELNLIMNILGALCGTIPPSYFQTADKDPTTAKGFLVDLRHDRLAMATEPNQKFEVHSEKVKSITGKDPIKARRLYKESEVFWFCPQFTPIMVAITRSRSSSRS